ncbi:restriction endonuclease subunit S [Lentibacillus sp. Marseille-P4043]|uniref:restriction endonuclease subunit S n=1 Tax=Lentibacillus sp. Marseille-P4043 TaxID=2040293 RepID=UPI000D0B898B|nr:restriction endonuclease subunit S [Lentibacillus sp. Marseille-P4043]
MSYKDYQLDEIFNMSRKNVKPNDIPEEQFLHYSIPAYDNGEKPLLERGASIKSNKYLLKEPSILVSKLNPRINRVWKFDNEDKNKINSICSTEFMVYERKSSDIDLEYYYQFFKSKIFQRYLLNLQSGSTGSRMRVSPKDTLSIPIPKPTKKQQQKIAAILSSVDETIEKTEQIIEQTETVKKGLMQQLLTKGIGHTDFKSSPLGEIPRNWEVLKVNEFAIVDYGISEAVSNNTDPNIGIPIITGANITLEGNLDLTKQVYVKKREQERFQLNKGDLLFNWRSGSQKHVGKTAIFNLDDEYTYASFILKIRVNDDCNNKFYYHLLNYLKSIQYFSKDTSVQVNFKLNASSFRELLLMKPPLEEQKEISSRIDSINDKIKFEEQKIRMLNNIKQGLMQQLLTGKVRVPIDDNEGVPS